MTRLKKGKPSFSTVSGVHWFALVAVNPSTAYDPQSKKKKDITPF
jgi:hypothetical protein